MSVSFGPWFTRVPAAGRDSGGIADARGRALLRGSA
jgi:hypothetical protein